MVQSGVEGLSWLAEALYESAKPPEIGEQYSFPHEIRCPEKGACKSKGLFQHWC